MFCNLCIFFVIFVFFVFFVFFVIFVIFDDDDDEPKGCWRGAMCFQHNLRILCWIMLKIMLGHVENYVGSCWRSRRFGRAAAIPN